MNLPEVGLELCRKWEGFSATPYLCPAKVWTIGYGTTRYPDGRRVSRNDPAVTRDQAEAYLRHEVEAAARKALFYSPILQWHPERWGAITSFIYNLGPGRYYASTLRRRVNELDWEGAVKEIQRWVYGGGRKLPGLVARRREEAAYLVPNGGLG